MGTTSIGTIRTRATPPVGRRAPLSQPSSCQRIRSSTSLVDSTPLCRQRRTVSSPFSLNACNSKHVHARPCAGKIEHELLGDAAGAESHRVDAIDGRFQVQRRGEFDRRATPGHRPVVAPTRLPVGPRAVRAEPGEHVARRQCGELAERADAQSLQQVDQRAGAGRVEGVDRQPGEELGRPAGVDDDAAPRGLFRGEGTVRYADHDIRTAEDG